METLIDNKTKIQEVKSFLVRYAKIDRWNNNSASNFNDEAQSIIERIAIGDYGFASEIAQTVVKYNFSISEKQAYWVARKAVENEMLSNIDYLLKKKTTKNNLKNEHYEKRKKILRSQLHKGNRWNRNL